LYDRHCAGSGHHLGLNKWTFPQIGDVAMAEKCAFIEILLTVYFGSVAEFKLVPLSGNLISKRNFGYGLEADGWVDCFYENPTAAMRRTRDTQNGENQEAHRTACNPFWS
jgi:hypothetical protein